MCDILISECGGCLPPASVKEIAMAKKSGGFSVIYLIGCALVVAGFICPMFKGAVFGATTNGFDYLNFKNFGTTTIAGLLIFCGAVLGVVIALLKGKGAKTLKLVCIIASIAGGVLLIVKFNDNALTKAVGKGFFKHAYFGFYMICAGWIAGLYGALKSK